MKILATIITYNPEYDLLNYNLLKLIKQVDEILIVNNGDTLTRDKINNMSKLTIIENEINKGIACALNTALQYAVENQYIYLLSMDQDSIIPDYFVINLMKYFDLYENVGVVGPNIIEKELGENKSNNVNETSEVTHVITSGSLNDVQALVKSGGFDEKLFIDMVDLDMSYKVIDSGYKIIQTSEVELEHRIGEPEIRVHLFKKHFIRNHSPFRKYFFVRNRLYLAFKYRSRGLKFVFGHLIGIVYYTYITMMFETNKIFKLKMILLGVFDFLRGNYDNRIMK
ncbi:glycosyltransferase [Haloplasma contractile]|uniref:Rhamnosyl transferase I protein n=1 Tax=Haloplasma contractile SSD-17B TaxID=1033810 RepID=U2E854_9MOLU|nr:glycosyltransferase [Haloplasma contractile]ERJ11056.1 Rhamnosyl transferase I protein [Haloplasma contractile SSD-17B]